MISGNYSNFFARSSWILQIIRFTEWVNLQDQKKKNFLPSKDEYSIRHFSLYNMEKYMKAHIVYALTEAEIKRTEGKKFSVLYVWQHDLLFLVVLPKGYKAGVRGLLSALCTLFFRLMVAMRMYEIDNNLTIASMEQEFNKEKQRLLSKIEH